ncbi:alkene reductase [Nostoc sp. DedQUE09]|uniref:alkene reductase n=1 Tax=Nostoc sp. DedQUE09 TaxID=3075394 RepID=UPI002AD2F2D1|nr:alkene reductase [Nostoc sp. DedQUE09]MDZ7956125.1 alkene reductase [Nostoc sp. DedQUE09]
MREIDLFTPLELGSLTLPNRIAMAPLTRSRAGSGQKKIPTALNATYYAQRASAGLIVAEATQVSSLSTAYPNTPGIFTPEQTAGWKLVTDAVHQQGGRIFLQLWHAGRVAHPLWHPEGATPIGPSAIAAAGQTFTPQGMQPYVTPRTLETDEVSEIIHQFQQGAENALAAGFDGVEIHGAFGYIIDQFLQDNANQRSDRYGGSLENRVRFLLEVVDAVVQVWGTGRVGIKLSPSNTYNGMADSDRIATFSYAIAALNEFNLAYLHLMEASEADLRHGGQKIPTSLFRPIYKGILMLNGGYTKESANAALADGNADLVSFGTLFLANPDLPERFRRNAALNQPDPATFYAAACDDSVDDCGFYKGYTDYPVLN